MQNDEMDCEGELVNWLWQKVIVMVNAFQPKGQQELENHLTEKSLVADAD